MGSFAGKGGFYYEQAGQGGAAWLRAYAKMYFRLVAVYRVPPPLPACSAYAAYSSGSASCPSSSCPQPWRGDARQGLPPSRGVSGEGDRLGNLRRAFS